MNGARTSKSEVIEEALKRINMSDKRNEVLMVGDKEHDVLGARAAGLDCVAAVSYTHLSGYNSGISFFRKVFAVFCRGRRNRWVRSGCLRIVPGRRSLLFPLSFFLQFCKMCIRDST